MGKQTFLQRYTLIIRRLEKGPAKYNELAEYLAEHGDELGNNFNISQRTLQRDIKDIARQLGYVIENELAGAKRYYIAERPDTNMNSERLLEAYEMVNLLNASQDNSKYIFFEQRRSKGHEHFNALLFAIRNKRVTMFNYEKYQTDSITKKVVHPIALKESRGRWYLLAVEFKTSRTHIRTYGLDRISELDITTTSFKSDYGFDIERMYEHAFGIIDREGEKPERVRLRFTNRQGNYIKTYPLHHSQTIVTETENELIIELELWITFDFILELMSYGPSLEALAPRSLVEALVDNYSQALGKYGEKNEE